MNFGESLITWTIRLAMLLLFLAMALRVRQRPRQTVGPALRLLWTASFILSALHVLAAFHFVHHWSHHEAYLATADDTLQKLGFAFGAGVYFNYLFLIVWAFDIYWTWRATGQLSMKMQRMLLVGRLYLFFIAFNGVVVFESGWLRALGIVATLILIGGFLQNQMLLKDDDKAFKSTN